MKFQSTLLLASLFICGCISKNPKEQTPPERPNILWIVVEDMSSHFGYQGEKLVKTPNVDRLATEGVLFRNAYVSAPVCSASRSAMINGMYQTSIGAHHHRSSRGELKIQLPEGIKTIPEMFREAGYYTCNGTEKAEQKGKEDYNFVYDSKALYDRTDWSGREEGQPFFAQVQLRGGKLRNVAKWQEEVLAGLDTSLIVHPGEVTLPPYYPDVPAFRKDWADYLNNVQYTDKEVGAILTRLEKENLIDNTVIFFITDHGISQARGKQFLYDEGTRIPFIVWAPNRFKSRVNDDLISHIDMSATSLQLAGIKIPDYMDANPLLSENYKARDYIVCARDRCDETVDRIRSVRKGNFKYIKNYLPQRPYLQPCAYKDGKPWMSVLKELDKQGQLNEIQQLVTAKTRAEEELYDLANDPFEINNLAKDEKHSEQLKEMRENLEKWIIETGDKGINPESPEMYDSDMKVYVNQIKRRKPKEAIIIEQNIMIMKKWATEGK
jgi:arylsulfatase A-like enzyme